MDDAAPVVTAARERAAALADGDAERLSALLRADVTDVVLTETGEPATFRMPVTQVWVRDRDRWLCLAGHAGPRLSP